ncbi:MAG: GNAT family N-acetyltransferase [Atopobiaceae bacterium]|jgi:GNAT superfamily N-acetyltransferase|nr:GNAT family N-acetyltransferase [Atopobiaceae bacterium]
MADKNSQVILRELTDGDFPVVSGIVARLWYGHLSGAWALVCGAAELAHHLARQTHARVAVDEQGRVLGCVLARYGMPDYIDVEPWERRFEASLDAGRAATDFEIGEELAVCDAEDAIAAATSSRPEFPKDSAIELLVVDRDAQGSGIGRRLFNDGLSYLRWCGATHYYLITDDSCDWSFYEHEGLERAESHLIEASNGAERTECFSYVGKL